MQLEQVLFQAVDKKTHFGEIFFEVGLLVQVYKFHYNERFQGKIARYTECYLNKNGFFGNKLQYSCCGHDEKFRSRPSKYNTRHG